MKTDETLPKDIKKMVNTDVLMAGHIFSYTKEWEETTFSCLSARWGHSYVMNLEDRTEKHPTFQLLLKNRGMKRAQWCLPMPYRKINL